MRNWNRLLGFRQIVSSGVFILPMRNWNSKVPKRAFSAIKFSSYLWGIETFYVDEYIEIEVNEFSSYLWGIETVSGQETVTTENGFSSYLWGIETLTEAFLWSYERRFHLTYEELKLVFRLIRLFNLACVFILPMRNWNTVQTWEKVRRQRFSSYLWGIETQVRRHRLFYSFTFSSYLWGIETKKKTDPRPSGNPFSSYLWGIETWKIQLGRFVPTLFSSYLWGIETAMLHNLGLSEPVKFSSYLWGIETYFYFGASVCFLRFHLTYEELKREWREYSRYNGHSVFILPMRNWNPLDIFLFLFWFAGFSSYLWGIETLTIPRILDTTDFLFSSYLWGIETLQSFPAIGKLPSRFHLTYEELKLSCIKCIFPEKNVVFILPMRNWNFPA